MTKIGECINKRTKCMKRDIQCKFQIFTRMSPYIYIFFFFCLDSKVTIKVDQLSNNFILKGCQILPTQQSNNQVVL